MAIFQKVKMCSQKIQAEDPFAKILQYSMNKCKSVSDCVDYYCEEYGIYMMLENAARNFAEYPLLSAGVLLVLVSCVLPIFIFATCILLAVFLTLSGFLVIEGTILTIVSVMFVSFLAVAGIAIAFVGGSVLLGYAAMSYFYDNCMKNKDN